MSLRRLLSPCEEHHVGASLARVAFSPKQLVQRGASIGGPTSEGTMSVHTRLDRMSPRRQRTKIERLQISKALSWQKPARTRIADLETIQYILGWLRIVGLASTEHEPPAVL